MASLGLYSCPDCGTDCGNTCVTFVTNDCPEVIELCLSEICKWMYSCPDPDDPTQPLFAPTDWTAEADWEAAITAGLIGVNVIGDIPEPTQDIVQISKGRQKFGTKTFTANIDIDEWTIDNYEAMRQLSCGATMYNWFQTRSGVIFGGPTGVRADVIKANSPLTRGDNQYKRILIGLEWEAKCDPPATDQVPAL